MKAVVLYTLCLCSALAGCAHPARHDVRTALDAQLRANALEHGIPAQAVLILHNGETVYRNVMGTTATEGGSPAAPQTIFPVYSVSKLYASTIALQLVEEGALDLSAPASRYVPTLPSAWRDIRVEQFLSHVSGVPEYFDRDDLSGPFPPTLDAALAGLADVPLDYPAGERTRYTQTNYLVLEKLLETVTRTPYRDLVRHRIIEPIGLHETWLEESALPGERVARSYRADNGRVVPEPPIDWPDYAIVHAGIHTTLDDMGRFLSAVAQGRLVSKAGLVKFWRPYRLDNGDVGFFASGWDYGERGRWHEVGHDGATKVRVRILFREDLDDHHVIVYLTNGNNDDVWSRTLVDSVQALVVPASAGQ